MYSVPKFVSSLNYIVTFDVGPCSIALVCDAVASTTFPSPTSGAMRVCNPGPSTAARRSVATATRLVPAFDLFTVLQNGALNLLYF
jgi:hypothetical protein